MDPLIENVDAQNSYNLFHIIMQAPVSPKFPEEKKWGGACLTIHGAYKWDNNLLQIKGPQYILTFLNHHLNLITGGHQGQEGPVQNAMDVLTRVHGLSTIEPKDFNLINASFVYGICCVFQEGQPLQLRTAALCFLPHLGDKWFNTPHQIMGPNTMRNLCADWASTVDGIEHTNDIQRVALTVFLWMINSPHWRPHIPAEKWMLLEHFTSLPDDSEPLRRCINNPQLMGVIRNMGNPVTTTLWFVILWYKYKHL